MAFLGLYDEVMRVSTEPTTKPAVATYARATPTGVPTRVCTYLVYLLLYLLYNHALYLVLLSSTYYVLTNVRTALLMYIYILNKKGTYCTYILYARTASTDRCTHCLYLLLMYVRILKKKSTSCCKYLLPYVRTYCTYLVLSCNYWCTYAPNVRTASSNATSTHLLQKTAVPTVRIYCCTYT